jgi:hypothetical protein
MENHVFRFLTKFRPSMCFYLLKMFLYYSAKKWFFGKNPFWPNLGPPGSKWARNIHCSPFFEIFGILNFSWVEPDNSQCCPSRYCLSHKLWGTQASLSLAWFKIVFFYYLGESLGVCFYFFKMCIFQPFLAIFSWINGWNWSFENRVIRYTVG